MQRQTQDTESIGHLFARLVDDGERFARAEIALYRAQLFARLADAKMAIVLGAAAFFIGQAAIIALLVGLVLVVRPYVHSAGWATVIVVGGALALVALLLALAIARMKRATAVKASSQ